MSADILSLLDDVRDTHGGNYLARCPAHEDKSPSLSVKLCSDGRVLLHCFAGCDIEDICASLGLTLAQLMPEIPGHHYRAVRKTMPAREGLQSLDHECLVVAVIAGDVLQHHNIDEPTFDRLRQAVIRIGRVRDECIPARHKG